MAVDIRVTGDLKNATRHLSALQRRSIPKVATQSLNRAGRSMFAETKKAISTELGIRPKEVKDRIVMEKAARVRLFTRIRPNKAGRRPLNLIAAVTPAKRYVGAYSKRRGVAAKIGGKAKIYNETFIINAARSGKPIVVIRKGPRRLPVVAKSLPSVQTVIKRKEVRRRVIAKGRAAWSKEFARNLQREINRLEVRNR